MYFDRRKGFKVPTQNVNELRFLQELKSRQRELGISIEKQARRLNSSFIFTVPDCNHPIILSLMRKLDIFDYEVFNPIFHQHQGQQRRFGISTDSFDPDIVTKTYLSYEESDIYIHRIVNEIRANNPKVSVKISIEGESFERRPIKSITIIHGERPQNPVIFIDAGKNIV